MSTWGRVVVAGVAGCAAALFGAGTPPASAVHLQSWMVSRTAIGLIDAYMGSTTLTKNAFDASSTLEIGGAASGWSSQRTATYTAYGSPTAAGTFAYALAHGTVPKGTADVLYDDEDWSLTPRAEQVHPATYMAEFVRAAHAHGYRAVLAPGMDIVDAMSCYKPADSAWANYVTDCQIPRLAAQAMPDVYEVQSQRYESGAPLGVLCGCYSWLVDQSAAEARSVSPALAVLAGLSTNEDGAVATPQSLYDDSTATALSAAGYWLNVPEKSKACPQCVAGGAPQVAVGYLEMLGYSS